MKTFSLLSQYSWGKNSDYLFVHLFSQAFKPHLLSFFASCYFSTDYISNYDLIAIPKAIVLFRCGYLWHWSRGRPRCKMWERSPPLPRFFGHVSSRLLYPPRSQRAPLLLLRPACPRYFLKRGEGHGSIQRKRGNGTRDINIKKENDTVMEVLKEINQGQEERVKDTKSRDRKR